MSARHHHQLRSSFLVIAPFALFSAVSLQAFAWSQFVPKHRTFGLVALPACTPTATLPLDRSALPGIELFPTHLLTNSSVLSLSAGFMATILGPTDLPDAPEQGELHATQPADPADQVSDDALIDSYLPARPVQSWADLTEEAEAAEQPANAQLANAQQPSSSQHAISLPARERQASPSQPASAQPASPAMPATATPDGKQPALRKPVAWGAAIKGRSDVPSWRSGNNFAPLAPASNPPSPPSSVASLQEMADGEDQGPPITLPVDDLVKVLGSLQSVPGGVFEPLHQGIKDQIYARRTQLKQLGITPLKWQPGWTLGNAIFAYYQSLNAWHAPSVPQVVAAPAAAEAAPAAAVAAPTPAQAGAAKAGKPKQQQQVQPRKPGKPGGGQQAGASASGTQATPGGGKGALGKRQSEEQVGALEQRWHEEAASRREAESKLAVALTRASDLERIHGDMRAMYEGTNGTCHTLAVSLRASMDRIGCLEGALDATIRDLCTLRSERVNLLNMVHVRDAYVRELQAALTAAKLPVPTPVAGTYARCPPLAPLPPLAESLGYRAKSLLAADLSQLQAKAVSVQQHAVGQLAAAGEAIVADTRARCERVAQESSILSMDTFVRLHAEQSAPTDGAGARAQ